MTSPAGPELPFIPVPRVEHALVNARTGMVWSTTSLCTLSCSHSALVGAIAQSGDTALCIVCRAPMCITSVTPVADIPLVR